ncbi:hypothetical protein ACJMK2_006108 [Sinanodonta woodiana]|uniref:G-protein coupled receptors family 1 profile domain-containing protein n=1 Tax=Sinanodonta woodiana TaxID=1069815 RepID=A0ABD3VS45_SINWO
MTNYTILKLPFSTSTTDSVTYAGNFTTTNYTSATPEDPYFGYSVAERVIIGIILVTIIFLAISGNILVCIAVFTDRRLKHLNNLFLVSLAIADLLVAGVVMTFAVVNDISGTWMFGSVFCNIWVSSDVMCSTASILNLCVISLDRYIHIRDPLKYARLMTWKKVAAMIAFVWIMSVIISFLPIHLGWHRNNSQQPPDKCILEISGTYAIVSSTISFYIPCIVMLALYCKLYMYARQQVKSIKSTLVGNHLQDSKNSGKGTSSKVSDHKAAVTLGIIMGVFLFCWLPFFILNLIEAYCRCAPIILFQILTWLGYVNSCLNPIIYSIFNQEFRSAFKKILFQKTCHVCMDDRASFDFSPSKAKNGRNHMRKEYLIVENGSKASRDSTDPLCSDAVTAV